MCIELKKGIVLVIVGCHAGGNKMMENMLRPTFERTKHH